MTNVCVVGSANADLVVAVTRRPQAGETLLGGPLSLYPGGKGANQAVAAARAGANVSFVGAVGDDPHGRLLRSSLAGNGVNIDGLLGSDEPTGTAVIFVTPDGENSIVVSPAANHTFTTDGVESVGNTWRSAAVIVLSLEIPMPTVQHVASQASGRVIVNAAPGVELSRDLLERCDPLVVNEHEARLVLGLDETDAASFETLVERLCSAGALSAVITLGEAGAIVRDEAGATAMIPAFPVPVVDTTGAGDAFVGAMAAQLAVGTSLTDAARFASAMAALAVQRPGAQASYPARADVVALLKGK